jgi:hypothetical protein
MEGTLDQPTRRYKQETRTKSGPHDGGNVLGQIRVARWGSREEVVNVDDGSLGEEVGVYDDKTSDRGASEVDDDEGDGRHERPSEVRRRHGEVRDASHLESKGNKQLENRNPHDFIADVVLAEDPGGVVVGRELCDGGFPPTLRLVSANRRVMSHIPSPSPSTTHSDSKRPPQAHSFTYIPNPAGKQATKRYSTSRNSLASRISGNVDSSHNR